MIYPHAVKIARPENRDLMPRYAFTLLVAQEWCSKYVVDHWAYDNGTFSFFHKEDLDAFVQRFGITFE